MDPFEGLIPKRSGPPDKIDVQYLASILVEYELAPIVPIELARAIVGLLLARGVLAQNLNGVEFPDAPGATHAYPPEAAAIVFDAFRDLLKATRLELELCFLMFTRTRVPDSAAPSGYEVSRLSKPSEEVHAEQMPVHQRLTWERDQIVREFGERGRPFAAAIVNYLIARLTAAIEANPSRSDHSPSKLGLVYGPGYRLEIDEANGVANLDGERFPLTEAQTRILSRLAAANGGWVPGKNLKGKPGSNERPDRVIDDLPPKLRAIIETKTGAGSRLKME